MANQVSTSVSYNFCSFLSFRRGIRPNYVKRDYMIVTREGKLYLALMDMSDWGCLPNQWETMSPDFRLGYLDGACLDMMGEPVVSLVYSKGTQNVSYYIRENSDVKLFYRNTETDYIYATWNGRVFRRDWAWEESPEPVPHGYSEVIAPIITGNRLFGQVGSNKKPYVIEHPLSIVIGGGHNDSEQVWERGEKLLGDVHIPGNSKPERNMKIMRLT